MAIAVLGLAVLALYPSGCQKGDSATTLKDRAAKYWQLKQAKGWEEVYDQYLDPTVKSKLTKQAFLKRRRLAFDILSYEISEVLETGDTGTVAVANEANFPIKVPTGDEIQLIKKRVTTTDQWARRDGVWYVELSQ